MEPSSPKRASAGLWVTATAVSSTASWNPPAMDERPVRPTEEENMLVALAAIAFGSTLIRNEFMSTSDSMVSRSSGNHFLDLWSLAFCFDSVQLAGKKRQLISPI
jgi:hypothetical protein